jgi:hypothetical protein
MPHCERQELLFEIPCFLVIAYRLRAANQLAKQRRLLQRIEAIVHTHEVQRTLGRERRDKVVAILLVVQRQSRQRPYQFYGVRAFPQLDRLKLTLKLLDYLAPETL